MNEQIKELWELSQTRQEVESFTEGVFHTRVTDNYEKFAELIIKECIGCCEQAISDPVPKSVDTWLNGGSQCIDEIKQHFGVNS